MIASKASGRSGIISSKLTMAGATMAAMRANVVTPATPELRPIVGKSSPENKYRAGTVPCYRECDLFYSRSRDIYLLTICLS